MGVKLSHAVVVVVIGCGSWQGNSEENARDYRGDFGTETVTRLEARRSPAKMALYTRHRIDNELTLTK